MSVTTVDPQEPSVSVTEAALRHFETKLAAADKPQVVRVSTQSSGCTGYAYVLDMVEAPNAGDEVITASDTVTLAIDPAALDMIRGTEIDLVTEGVNRVLKFKNPNVVAECGCGESFSVN